MDTGLNSLKPTSKKVVQETGEFSGNKIADVVTNSYDYKIVKTKLVEEVNILPRKDRKNVKRIKAIIIKMEQCKIPKLLNYSTVSKFVTKK